MRSTGRRYMRIDGAVDDRLDPFRSTEAAAQLLAYNYRVLGTWPLALTAYNHGTAGMLRAKETLGTDDIVTHRAQLHQPHLRLRLAQLLRLLPRRARDRPQSREVLRIRCRRRAKRASRRSTAARLRADRARSSALLKIDGGELRALNPALLPPVWSGQQRVPKDYRLRLPLEGEPVDDELLAQRLSAGGPVRRAARAAALQGAGR